MKGELALLLGLLAGAPQPSESAVAPKVRVAQVQTWSGSGQIISGPGSGGTLRLAVEVDGDHYRSLEGPMLNTRSDRPAFTYQGSSWNFQFSGRYLYVTLTRPNGQVINFTLTQ